VFNLKFSGCVAGIAFLISFLLGLLSGSNFLTILTRAGIFAIVFFGLASAGYWLLIKYVPELFQQESEILPETDFSELGKKININIESNMESEEVKKEEENLISSKAIDQNEEAEYTYVEEISANESETSKQPEASVINPPVAALPIGVIDDVDELPDLESMADSFVSPLSEIADEGEQPVSASPLSPGGDRSKVPAAGDFDPKEMAMAIQTLLKRDQKG
jgi:hypothetical protein